jgi:hypothetical protein
MLAAAARNYQNHRASVKRQSLAGAPVEKKAEEKKADDMEAKKKAAAEEEEKRRKAKEEEERKKVEAQQKKEQEEKAQEEESKKKEANKKPIPRPPPLPTCWPPQVVDGKNVGGDAVGVNLGGMGGPAGGGRGGLLGALLGGRGGGRGGGGPLAFLKGKAGGAAAKPAGPKLKQLHWETLATTEGTLWEENSDAVIRSLHNYLILFNSLYLINREVLSQIAHLQIWLKCSLQLRRRSRERRRKARSLALEVSLSRLRC